MTKVCVFGAANVDIGGFPSSELRQGDSNPGRIRVSMGGVGFNIARNAARLGLCVELCAALGGDLNASLVEEACRKDKIGLSYARRFHDAAMSAYLFLADAQGDMVAAVNDMSIVDKLTPDALQAVLPLPKNVSVAVIDANLPEESICYLARELRIPIFAEAVSAAKVGKMRSSLPYFRTFKLNRIEAEQLTGKAVTDKASAEDAVRWLLDAGVEQVYLTCGAQGICCGNREEIICLPAAPCEVVNATGAGDAFAAALLWAFARDMDLIGSALAGEAAASIALASCETVSDDMSETSLIERIGYLKKINEEVL